MHRQSIALLAFAGAFAAAVAFNLTTNAPAFICIAVAVCVFGACAHAFGSASA